MARDLMATSSASSSSLRPMMKKPAVSKRPKVSDRLEEDAVAMETRLIQLKIQLEEEKRKREREKPLKHNGNRWRSAREDRGSVSAYAKDIVVQKTTEKKPSKPKTTNNQTVNAMKWTTQDVVEWLRAIGMDEYTSAFEFHQVTGGILLQLTMDDLVAVGVTKLSARNLLLCEAEKLKPTKKPKRIEPAEIQDPQLTSESLSKGVHWSQLKPIAENQVAGSEDVPVNLADGEFDEAASHASFLKALLDWRGSDDQQAANKTENDDTFWFNPADRHEEEQETGGALLEGDYDEEKEHEAFRKAVEAWRYGNKPQEEVPSIERIEAASTTAQRKSCWQCYRIVTEDTLVVDHEKTHKSFCSVDCQSAFQDQYARFYK